MIRRTSQTTEAPPAWILIPQTEHARLAGELADVWQSLPVSDRLQKSLRWVIYHHDDGWAEWEREPDVDERQRPVDFLEMAHPVANRIWTRSIERAAERGAAEAYLVARHFLDLREAGILRATDVPAGSEPIDFTSDACPGSVADCEFTRHFETCARQWQQAAVEQIVSSTAADDLVRARLRLQHFDWLSLLLCCDPTHKRELLPEPLEDAGKVELVPRDEWQFTLDPWPLRVNELELAAHAWSVPVAEYASGQAVMQAATSVVLRWQLLRG
ncbi:MAG: DUF3891 family protein [Planctomycetales bacterium]|nr:DUF3891 family protein [Planctomycetales bacterium]